MNRAWMAAAVLLAATGVQAHQSEFGMARDLTVYVESEVTIPNYIVDSAENSAVAIFGELGVRLMWRHSKPPAGVEWGEAIRLLYKDCFSGSKPGAVAYAMPYEGSTVVVFYRRLQWAEAKPALAPKLLAHVLVHEIVHNLEGIEYHARTGMMKALWTRDDYAAMLRMPLPFEPSDIELIQFGFNARVARRAH